MPSFFLKNKVGLFGPTLDRSCVVSEPHMERELESTGNAVSPVRVSDAADNQWRTRGVQRREYRIEQVGADSSILQVGEVQDLSATAYIASIGTQTSNTGEEIRRRRARRSERKGQEIKVSVAIKSLEVGMVKDIEGIGAQFQTDVLC